MKKIKVLIFLAAVWSLFSYPYAVPYYDEEFFLYPFLNYDQSPEMKRSRESRLYEGGFVQTSHGSQTTWLLMRSEEAVVSRDAGDDFFFRFRYKELESRHLSYKTEETSFGIGYRLNGMFSLMTSADMSDEKAEIDIEPGLLFKFQTVYAYLGIRFDDFLFDVKNTGDGRNNSTPLTIKGDLRFSFNRLYFFLSGFYGTGIDRTWPDNWLRTDVLEQKTKIREFYFRTEFDLTGSLRLYQENIFSSFGDARKLTGTAVWDTLSYSWELYEKDISEYDFSAKIYNIRIGGIWALNEKSSFDAGVSYARTEHEFDLLDGAALENNHAGDYTVDYPALLPYIIYRYRIHTKFTAEAAYMGCCTLSSDKSNPYYVKYGEDYWDKDLLKIGLEYAFSPGCSLYISAGQLINTGVFGGGNARFNFFF